MVVVWLTVDLLEKPLERRRLWMMTSLRYKHQSRKKPTRKNKTDSTFTGTTWRHIQRDVCFHCSWSVFRLRPVTAVGAQPRKVDMKTLVSRLRVACHQRSGK